MKLVGNDMGSFDPFKPDKHGYDPDKFYPQVDTDTNGKGETVYFKIGSAFNRKLEELIASGKFPELKTKADFYRDSSRHRYEYLGNLAQDLDMIEFSQLQISLMRQNSRLIEMNNVQLLLEQHDKLMSDAVEHKDSKLLFSLIQDAEHDMEILRGPYRDRLKNLIERYSIEMKRL